MKYDYEVIKKLIAEFIRDHKSCINYYYGGKSINPESVKKIHVITLQEGDFGEFNFLASIRIEEVQINNLITGMTGELTVKISYKDSENGNSCSKPEEYVSAIKDNRINLKKSTY